MNQQSLADSTDDRRPAAPNQTSTTVHVLMHLQCIQREGHIQTIKSSLKDFLIDNNRSTTFTYSLSP